MKQPIEADGPNADQIKFWNDAGGQNFVRHQTALDSMLEDYGKRAMERAGVETGQVVLDIGCGCGDTTIDLARRVGPTGEVVGVDISEIMLSWAEDLLGHTELTNVFFELADVETSPLHRDSFDLAFPDSASCSLPTRSPLFAMCTACCMKMVAWLLPVGSLW